MKMRYVAAISVLLVCLSVAATAQMTHEEITVRAAYAKLSYAAGLGVLARNVLSAQAGSDNALSRPSELLGQMKTNLTFDFSGFRTGSLADIADVRWDGLVTKPQQDLVNVVITTLPYRLKLSRGDSITTMTYAAANWQRFNEPFDADWSTPVRTVVQDLPKDTHAPQVVYSRYAAFTVSVKLAARQRTYLALFLFGRNPDGTQAVFPVDHVLGMGSLKFFMENSIYPQPLLETHLREWPGVRDWIASAAVSSVSTGRDVACDGVSGVCGIPAKVLDDALTTPIDPETRQFVPKSPAKGSPSVAQPTEAPEHTQAVPGASCSNYDEEFTFQPTAFGTFDHGAGGQHSVEQNAVGSCTYSSGNSQFCTTVCVVQSSEGSTVVEKGKTTSGNCHVVGLGWANGNGGAANGGIACSGTLTGGAT